MTEKFYVGSKSDCEILRTALDLIYDYPAPPPTGPYACTPEQKQLRTAQWFALSKEQRDSKQFDPLWYGWTLRYSDLVEESAPGVRFGIWVPSDLAALMSAAVSNGVIFSLEQTLGMIAASASALSSTPVDWVEPP
jgi:hypothetical protein